MIFISKPNKRWRYAQNSSRARLLSVYFSASDAASKQSPSTENFSHGAAPSSNMAAPMHSRIFRSIFKCGYTNLNVNAEGLLFAAEVYMSGVRRCEIHCRHVTADSAHSVCQYRSAQLREWSNLTGRLSKSQLGLAPVSVKK